jgi:hypothetical protein
MSEPTLWGLVRSSSEDRDAHRPLDPKERYRALNDVFDMQQDLIDLGDKKARFALVIMGGLNAVAFFLLVRGDGLSSVPIALRPWLAVYVGLYGVAALYFFFQAIESLKPRIYSQSSDKDLLGLRFFEGILGRSEDDYRATWQAARMDQLAEEIAEQIHSLSRINEEKYAALRRLYLGLQVMTILTAGLIALLELGRLL